MVEGMGLSTESAVTLGALALLLIGTIVAFNKGALWTAGSVRRVEDGYKERIAEIRSEYESRIADIRINYEARLAEKQEVVDLYRSSEDVKQKILSDLAEGAKSSRAANETLMQFIQALDSQVANDGDRHEH